MVCAGCTTANMNFADVGSCEPEFDQATIARNPGVADRSVCLGLKPYNGFMFTPVGRDTSEWAAKRTSITPGAYGSVGCGGAVASGDRCTSLVATYEGPARNATALNRQTITLVGAPPLTFTLTGLMGILYSGQGVRLTGYRADQSTVSMVLAPSELLNPSFPRQQWSRLVSLDFVPDVARSGWTYPDEYATLKIFWLNTTVC